MTDTTFSAPRVAHPPRIDVDIAIALESRNRLTCLFRPLLAVPHLLLVGAPVGFVGLLGLSGHVWHSGDWSAGGGVLAAVAGVCALISWFEILFTGHASDGLWSLGAFYLRWRVRASAYAALLTDQYPPFGDGHYPATIRLERPTEPRDRITVALRLLLSLPHVVVLWALGVAWVCTTLVSWFSIMLSGKMPAALFEFGIGVLRWSARVEAYVLLLTDAYPPFDMEH